jgi:hypothetical protein
MFGTVYSVRYLHFLYTSNIFCVGLVQNCHDATTDRCTTFCTNFCRRVLMLLTS